MVVPAWLAWIPHSLDWLKQTGGALRSLPRVRAENEALRQQNELLRELRARDDEIATLRSKLADAERHAQDASREEFRENAVFFGEAGPYCVPCWGDKRRRVRLTVTRHENGATYGKCGACNHVVPMKPGQRQPPRRSTGYEY